MICARRQNLSTIIMLGISAGIALLTIQLISPVSAYAQEVSETAEINEPAVLSATPDRYDFVAEPCNNMTLLVRRAVMLYDDAETSLELTPAQIIYAETNIVRDMGPRMIDVGERVNVERSIVENYGASAQGLTEEQIAAWQQYADLARFDLSDIEPINVALDDDGSLDIDYSVTPSDDFSDADASSSSAEDDGAGWYWWPIGAGTVLLLWYVLWRDQDKE